MINLTEICCVARITIEIMQSFQSVIGAPDTIRTCDLCLRRATLYPAELRVRLQRRGLLAERRAAGYCDETLARNSRSARVRRSAGDRSDRRSRVTVRIAAVHG